MKAKTKVAPKAKAVKKAVASKKPAAKPSSGTSTATKTATRTATATKTSTEAYTQGNITVTGGAGAGPTSVTIAIPGQTSKTPKANLNTTGKASIPKKATKSNKKGKR